MDGDSKTYGGVCKPISSSDAVLRHPPFSPDDIAHLIQEAELRYRSELDGRPIERPRPPAGSAGDLTDIGLISILGKALRQVVQTDIEGASELTSEADARRYRYLKDHCSHHFPHDWQQPAEWGISWEFQQWLPEQAHSTFDSLIDADIERLAEAEEGEEAERAYARADHEQ